MSTSTDAILAYGYDLGSTDGWKVREAGKYGELDLPWLGEDDPMKSMERRLLSEVAGFTETWQPGSDGYFDRQREAKARLGVEIETYCSDSYPMYLLAAHVTTVWRGFIEAVDPSDLMERPAREGWDAKLAAAVSALGMTPVQPEPRWLLCSYWG